MGEAFRGRGFGVSKDSSAINIEPGDIGRQAPANRKKPDLRIVRPEYNDLVSDLVLPDSGGVIDKKAAKPPALPKDRIQGGNVIRDNDVTYRVIGRTRTPLTSRAKDTGRLPDVATVTKELLQEADEYPTTPEARHRKAVDTILNEHGQESEEQLAEQVFARGDLESRMNIKRTQEANDKAMIEKIHEELAEATEAEYLEQLKSDDPKKVEAYVAYIIRKAKKDGIDMGFTARDFMRFFKAVRDYDEKKKEYEETENKMRTRLQKLFGMKKKWKMDIDEATARVEYAKMVKKLHSL